MPWIGLLLGALIGASLHGFRGFVTGAAVGLVIGLVLRKSPLAGEPANSSRLAALEQRVAALEAALARPPIPLSAAGSSAPAAGAAGGEAPAVELAVAATAGTPSDVMAAPRSPVRKGGVGEPSAGVARAASSVSRPASAAAPSLWSWFTGGNAMVRVGIVVLFFGVAFLLSYFAEHVTIPIELQFSGVALAGAAMIGVGAWLSNARRAYALALVGGGLGVLYLTTFAALQLVPLLSPPGAFALLAAIAVLAVTLSLAFDAQALAALAALGGLLAPVLVETVSEPLPLFAYVAAVNAVILGIAWFRAWRALDLVGFAGTFVLGLWWGYEFYGPAYFPVVEPFLAGFFLAYVTVPIVHALRGAGERRVDAMLIFGVPMVGLALQALLVQDTRYGLAWTPAGRARYGQSKRPACTGWVVVRIACSHAASRWYCSLRRGSSFSSAVSRNSPRRLSRIASFSAAPPSPCRRSQACAWATIAGRRCPRASARCCTCCSAGAACGGWAVAWRKSHAMSRQGRKHMPCWRGSPAALPSRHCWPGLCAGHGSTARRSSFCRRSRSRSPTTSRTGGRA